MKVFTYSQARQNLARLLTLAQTEPVRIRRKDGSIFELRAERNTGQSPFDVPGINTGATTENILDAVRDSRSS